MQQSLMRSPRRQRPHLPLQPSLRLSPLRLRLLQHRNPPRPPHLRKRRRIDAGDASVEVSRVHLLRALACRP